MRRYRIEVEKAGKWFTVSRRAYVTLPAAIRAAEALWSNFRIIDYEKWFKGGLKEDAVVAGGAGVASHSPEWRLTELDR